MTKLSNEEIKEVSELKTTYSQIVESLFKKRRTKSGIVKGSK